jgi:Uma2 family endonuclease
MESWPRRHRITVDDYYRMAEIGVLPRDARVELIEGEIIDMAPIGTEHASVVDRLNHLLVHAVGERAIVRVQSAARLSHITEPEPDVAVLKPRADFYRHAHPRGDEILLLIEVSDSSLRYDRDIKMPLYARYGVGEFWLVDLVNGSLSIYGDLADGEYRAHTSIRDPALTALALLPDVSIDLGQIFER